MGHPVLILDGNGEINLAVLYIITWQNIYIPNSHRAYYLCYMIVKNSTFFRYKKSNFSQKSISHLQRAFACWVFYFYFVKKGHITFNNYSLLP